MADIAQLGFQVDSAPIARANRELGAMPAKAAGAERAAAGLSTGTGKAFASIERNVARVQGSISNATRLLIGFFSVQAGVRIATGLGRVADEFANINAKVRLAVGGNADLAQSLERVYGVAQRTFQTFDSTAALVQKGSMALRNFGQSADDAFGNALGLTEMFNKGLAISGAGADQAAAAAMQFSQALASGRFQGDEFRTVMELNSRFAQALADSLDVNVTKLREMSAAGELSTQSFLGLLKNTRAFDDEFAILPVTIGRALTQLDNAWTMLIGTLDQASQGSAGVAGMIQAVAQAIDIVRPSIAALVALWANETTATDQATGSAMKVAQAMKVVVTGVVLAKNVIDVLVDGLKAMVRFGIAGAEALIGTFNDLVDVVPQLVQAFKDPGNLGDNIGGVVSAALDRAKGRLDKFVDEGADAGRDFQKAFTSNVADVSVAFEFLLEPLKEIPPAARPVIAAVAGLGAAAGASEAEVSKLAAAQKAMSDLLNRLGGELGPVEKVWADYAKALSDAEAIGQKLLKLGVAESAVQRDVAEAIRLATKARDGELAVLRKKQGAPGQFLATMQQEIKLLGMTTRERNRAVAAMRAEEEMIRAIQEAKDAGKVFGSGEEEGLLSLASAMGEAYDEADELHAILSEIENLTMDPLVQSLGRVGEAMRKALDAGPPTEEMQKYLVKLQGAMDFLSRRQLSAQVGALGDMADAMGTVFEEGSKGQKKMQQASAALAVVEAGIAAVMGVQAILNQAKGEPYTAFARMAAMAAAVTPLIAAIGAAIPSFSGSGGPSAASAEVMQARQGTGTVLGDAEAKSESILNAMEITADATSELVGINRGMLRALQTLESGIGSASGMIARGGSAVDVGPLSSGGGILSGLPDPLGLSNMIFGGRQELIDQGIMIMGGTLNDLINNITVGAYNTIETDGGWFSSNDTDTNVTDITDQFGQQFSLIIESIAATVREGALALGLLPADIEAAMAAYQVEATRISLMGLSAEEQQAELTAVFSSIFDGLAGSVVPWVEQFQQLGEGLGETLVRVATSVQVTQEAMLQLGFALDQTDPEQFAQIAVGLIELTGGIDEFISGMSSFVSNFAPEAHQFAVAQDALTRALSQYGLEIPASRDGMWALMQSLDATTESGREQIATLLRLAGVADAYYSMLEDRASDAARAEADAAAEAARAQEEAAEIATRAEQARIDATLEYARLVTDLNLQLLEASGASEYARSMAEIGVAERQRIEALHASARAAGLASASEEDVARAYQLSTLQRARAERQLTESARGVVDQLYSPMTALDEQISALQASESAASSAIGDLGDSISDMGQIASDIANAMLGPFSSLKGRAKADYALKALSEGLVSLDTALQVGSSVYASGADFNAFRDAAFARAAARPQEQNTPTAIGNSVSRAMQELLDQRAALEAEQTRAERFGLAGELAQQIADLSLARGTSFDEVLESLGITGSQLQTDLGLSSEAALMEYLTALQAETRSFADLWTRATYGEQMIVDAINEAWHLQNIPPDPLLNPQPLPPVDPPGKEPVARPKALEEAQAAQIDELKAAIVTLTTQQAEQSRLIAALLARIAGSSESAAGSLHQIEVGGVMDRVRHASQETRIDPKPKPRVAVKP